MTTVELLNRRFAESLGRPNGVDARFKWAFSPDVQYLYQPPGQKHYERRSWANRLGKVWMLCQWHPPTMSREQWAASCAGYPYPEKGEYKPHPETALPAGVDPTEALTAGYIRSLGQQMEQAALAARDALAGRVDATTERCEREAQASVDAAEREFYEMVGDFEPLSWKTGDPYNPGDRGGPVSFGGV